MALIKTIRQIFEIFSKFDITVEDVERTIKYLQYFNYLVDKFNIDDFIKALIELQKDAGIEADGVLDLKTLRVLDQPRCGCVAQMRSDASANAKWGLDTIKFYIHSYDKDLSQSEWTQELSKGFSSWSKYIPIDVVETKDRNEANLLVAVGSGRSNNFDGPSGTLAWAYLVPSYNYKGQLTMMFDLAETWVISSSNNRGIKLSAVAAHEFGHTLGLEHSNVNSALMAPYYNSNIIEPQQRDDVTRIQSIYGVRQAPVPNPDPTPTDPSSTTTIIVRGDISSITIPGYNVVKK